MRPYLFYVYEKPIPSFFFLIMVGTLVTTYYLYRLGKKNQLRTDVMLDMGIFGLINGLLGARIFHILVEYPAYYWEKPIRVFEFWRGGFVSWGAFVAILATFLIYFRIRQLPSWVYFDVLAAAAPILKFFIRLACLLTGCCYGKPTDLPWGITFDDPDSTAYYYMGTTPLHPTQVYSMVHAILLFILIQLIYRHRRFDGQTTCLLAIGWTLPRFFIEFFRGDADRGIFWGLATGQIMGILISAFFVFFYFKLSRRHAT